jgi:hypothetical protein
LRGCALASSAVPRPSYDGILAGPVDGPRRVAAIYPDVEAVPGLAVEHRASGMTGKVVRIEGDAVVLRMGALGNERVLTLIPGAFAVGGKPVNLVRPRPAPTGPSRTASGSRAAEHRPARVARTSRIWVEGVHDAELIEKVWGADLRVEGVVVERLDGIDHLASAINEFRPGADARLGVLVDHLVPGSKEARLAAAVAEPDVLVTGTPFVDVWQAVRPKALGIERWPVVPKGQPWKEGVCAALGLGEPGQAWRRLLAAVRTYADLEPELVGAVEQLVDFVTA